MDPNQTEDFSGNSHLLLLHLWSDVAGRAWLLAKRLADGAVGRLCTPLPVLRLQLVSVNVWDCVCNLLCKGEGSGDCHLSAVSLIRWYAESARWLVLNRRSDKALENLHRVARINGKPINKLTKEVYLLLPALCTVCDSQSEADMSPMWCRCYTPTWKRRLILVSPHWQRTTLWRPEGWGASPSAWWLSGQIIHPASTCPPAVHQFIIYVPVCCPVYSSAFFPVSITSCLPVQLPNCPVDVLFSCLNIFLFTRLLVFTPSLVLKSNCASAIVCLLLQVCHQFCVLRFGDGLAEVRGESPH